MDDFDYINPSNNGAEGNKEPEGQNSGFVPNTQDQEWSYRGAGTGRKESFGQSSFTTFESSEQENKGSAHSQPWHYSEADVITKPYSAPNKKKKSSGGTKLWAQILISGGVAAVVAIAVCAVMLTSAKRNNEKLLGDIEALENKLSNVQNSINKNDSSSTKLPNVSTPDTVLPDTQEPVVTPQTPGTYMTPAQVYASCVDSVVAINGKSNRGASSGSGFILSEDGYVATNYHVVEGQTTLTVSTSDGQKYSAKYIGGNEANDIALIKMDAQDMPPVKVGNSSQLVVGEQVAAIGNPLGELASTLTVGYISAKDRIVATDGTQINMLQTDAAINPGNSGGPLFNMKGEVIGITSAKYSGTTNSGATIEGIGFAIPMDDVLGMLNDLREHGYITGGYLGIEASDVDQQAAELYGLPSGALIRKVTEGGCAEKAGMKVQDIIVDVGGQKVGNLNDLSRALNKFKAGEMVEITVYRGGKEVTLAVILDERPKELSDSSTNPEATTPSQPSIGGSIDDWFDFFLP